MMGAFMRRVIGSPVGLSVIIAIIILGLSLWAKSPRSPKDSAELVTIADTPRLASEEDADGDGLKQWEEDLWGTDPDNTDSDGDGTKDGDEPRLGRDPKTPAPNDKLNTVGYLGESAKNQYYEEDPSLSTTAVIGRDFFAALTAINQEGTYSPETLDRLAQESAKKISERVAPFQVAFTEKDLIVSSIEGAEALRHYANELGMLFLSYQQSTGTPSELTLFMEALEAESEELLARLDPYPPLMRDFAEKLIRIPVPESVKGIHLGLANDYDLLSQTVTRMRNMLRDPAANFHALAVYQTTSEDIAKRFTQIRQRLIEQKVSFLPGDAGITLFGLQ